MPLLPTACPPSPRPTSPHLARPAGASGTLDAADADKMFDAITAKRCQETIDAIVTHPSNKKQTLLIVGHKVPQATSTWLLGVLIECLGIMLSARKRVDMHSLALPLISTSFSFFLQSVFTFSNPMLWMVLVSGERQVVRPPAHGCG